MIRRSVAESTKLTLVFFRSGSILHRHHCNSKTLPTISTPSLTSTPAPPVLPPLHDQAGFEPLTVSTAPQGSRGGPSSYSPGYQPPSGQQMPTPIASRFLTGIAPAPATSSRSPPLATATIVQQHTPAQQQHSHQHHHSTKSGSSAEPYYAGSGRNSLYGGSPLLVSNIPLPPGVHNPLLQSPLMGNTSAAGMAGYHPQPMYSHGAYGASLSVSQQQQALAVQPPPHFIPKQHSGTGSIGSGQQQHPSAAGLPRPLSQQAFFASPPHSGNSTNGVGAGSSLHSAHGNGPDPRGTGSSGMTPGLMNDVAMYSPLPAGQTPAIRGSHDRSRGPAHRASQQPQPHQQRPAHPRQIQNQGQEARSLSAEELRMGDAKANSVKSFVRGMNAKLTEIRKAGLP